MTPLTLSRLRRRAACPPGYGGNSAARWPRSRRPRPGSRSSRSLPAPPALHPRPGQAGLLAGSAPDGQLPPALCAPGLPARSPMPGLTGNLAQRAGRHTTAQTAGSSRRPRDPGNHCLHPGYGAFPSAACAASGLRPLLVPHRPVRDPRPRRGRMGRFAVTRASAPCSRTGPSAPADAGRASRRR
jgi:hypothetical protein